MPYGITQCYLPPGRGDFPALTWAKAGTQFSEPRGMQGWVDLGTAVKVCSPCQRQHIIVSFAINTAVCGEIFRPLTPQSGTLTTRPLWHCVYVCCPMLVLHARASSLQKSCCNNLPTVFLQSYTEKMVCICYGDWPCHYWPISKKLTPDRIRLIWHGRSLVTRIWFTTPFFSNWNTVLKLMLLFVVCIIQLGKLLDTDEYQRRIVPCVVKLFSSTDRATRVKLLQQVGLEHVIQRDWIITVVSTNWLVYWFVHRLCHRFFCQFIGWSIGQSHLSGRLVDSTHTPI